MRASRLDKPLPKEFFANFLATVSSLYPDARLDRDSINDLYELAAEEWRNGRQLHVIVREVCSCDGKTVYPSAGASQRIARQKRLARAPLDAQDGAPFGIEQLRDSSAVERLKARVSQLQLRISQGNQGIENLRAAEVQARAAGQTKRAAKIAETISHAEQGLVTLQASLEVAVEQERGALVNLPWSSGRARPAPKPKPARQPPTTRKPKQPRERKPKQPRERKPKATAISESKRGTSDKVTTAKRIKATKPKKPKPRRAAEQPIDDKARPVPNETPAPIVDEDLAATFLNQLAKRS